VLAVWLGGPWQAGLAQAGNHTLSLAQYRARLDQVILEFSQTEDGDEARALREAQAKLADVEAVELPSGEVITLQPLLADDETLDSALARLRLMQSQLEAAEQDNTAGRLAVLERVLARPEFTPLYRPLSPWQRFLNWLRSLLDRLPEGPANPALAVLARAFGWLIAGVGGVLVALLLSLWLRGLLRDFVADAENRRREAGEAVPLTALEARQQAGMLAQAGNYRQAVRQLYLSALLALEESGTLHHDRSLTNREVLARVAHITPLQRHLQSVVETFDEVWYGVQEPDHATFLGYQQEIDALMDAVPQGRADQRADQP
jgi:hypothetical protein